MPDNSEFTKTPPSSEKGRDTTGPKDGGQEQHGTDQAIQQTHGPSADTVPSTPVQPTKIGWLPTVNITDGANPPGASTPEILIPIDGQPPAPVEGSIVKSASGDATYSTTLIGKRVNADSGLSDAEVKEYAQQMEAALDKKSLFGYGPNFEPDTNQMQKILAGLTFADRNAIERQIDKDMGGQGRFRDALTDREKPLDRLESASKVFSALDQPDNTDGDYAGHLRPALVKLHDAGSNLQQRKAGEGADIVANVVRPGIGEIKRSFDNFQNAEDERRRSDAEKDIVRTLWHMKAADIGDIQKSGLLDQIKNDQYLSRDTKDAIDILSKGRDNWTKNDNDVKALADLGLKSGRLDIFEGAVESSDKAREDFSTPEGCARIDKAFSNADDRQEAHDYVKWGRTNLAIDLQGYAHPWHSNPEGITRRLNDLDPAEQKEYKLGYDVAHGPLGQTLNDEQKDALKYYMDARQAMETAAGGIDKPLYKTWQSKLLGSDFEPSVFDSFEANKPNQIQEVFIHDEGKAANKIEAIRDLSPKEQELYCTNEEFKDRLDAYVNNDLKPGYEQQLANSLLDKVANGQPEQFSATEQVVLDNLKDTSGIDAIQHMEKAFVADDTLLARMQNPTTDEDKALRHQFQIGMHRVAEICPTASLIGNGLTESFANHQLENSLFKEGHAPLRLKIAVSPNGKPPIESILNASGAEKDRLKASGPNLDEQTKELQDQVLGTGERRDFLLNVLDKNDASELTPLEKLRSFSLALGTTQSEAQGALTGDGKFTTEQQRIDNVNNLSKEYFKAYGTPMNIDVLNKSNDPEFKDLLSKTEISPTQHILNTMTDQYEHTSVADPTINALWDRSQKDAAEYDKRVDDFLLKHGGNLTADQKKEFTTALHNYWATEKDYQDNKEGAGKALAQTTMTFAAVVGSMFAPEVSIPLLAATGAGGALYEIGLMRAVQGTDFHGDPDTLKKHGIEGATAAIIGIIGPPGKGLIAVGEVGAEKTIGSFLVQKECQGMLKDGAEQTLATNLSHISQVEAVAGGKECKAQLAELVDSVAAPAATAEQKKLMVDSLANQLRENALPTMTARSMHEIEQLGRSAATGIAAGVGADVVATAAGVQTPDEMWSHLPNTIRESALGASVFHVVFRGAGGLLTGAAAIGKDSEGKIFLGKGTAVKSKDGSEFTAQDDKYYPKPGDQIDTTAKPSLATVLKKPAELHAVAGKLEPTHSPRTQPIHHEPEPMAATQSASSERPTSSGQEKPQAPNNPSEIQQAQEQPAVGDENTVVKAAYDLGGSYEITTAGKVSRMTDAHGTAYGAKYDDIGSLSQIIGMQKDSSYAKESWVKDQDGRWEHTKAGKTTPVTDVALRNDGSISYKEGDDQLLRKSDGSLQKTDKFGRSTLEEVNPATEEAHIKYLAESRLKSGSDRKGQLFTDMMGAFQQRAESSGMSPQEVGKTYHELCELLEAKDSMLPEKNRELLVKQFMRDAAMPFNVSQKGFNTCSVANHPSVQMYCRCPADAARVIKEVVTTGQTVAADGSKITLTLNDMQARPGAEFDPCTQREIYNPNARTQCDQILQTLAVNTYWQRQSIKYGQASDTLVTDVFTNAPGSNDVPPNVEKGSIKYELEPTRDWKKPPERLYATYADPATNEMKQVTLGYSPLFQLHCMNDAYTQLTGRPADFVIASKELASTETEPLGIKTFSSEAEFNQLLAGMQPSKSNPLVIAMHTGAEPFAANGADKGLMGYYHILSITGAGKDANGSPIATIYDSNHGLAGQPVAEGSKQNRIDQHDLYLSSLKYDSEQLVRELAKDVNSTYDPIRFLQLLRATYAKGLDSSTPHSPKSDITHKQYRAILRHLLANADEFYARIPDKWKRDQAKAMCTQLENSFGDDLNANN